MKKFQLIGLLFMIFFIKCNSSSKENKSFPIVDSKKIENPKINKKPEMVKCNTNIKSKKTQKLDIKSKVQYLSFAFKNKKNDSIIQKIKIAENIVTFFIPNERFVELEKFNDSGFPMEFWSTGMCSFFCFPIDEFESKIKIAKNLGYDEYGFSCENLTNKKKEERILTNQLKIEFTSKTSQTIIDEILHEKEFYDIQKFTNIYTLRIKNGSSKNIVNQFKKLAQNINIEFIDFSYSSCDY